MHVLNVVINLLRSIPFLILMIMVLPLSRAIIGTAVGTTATIVPLVAAAFPFVARLVESSLRELDPNIIEAAQSMGASLWTIIWKVLLAEARTSLIVGATIALGTILGYSAMAGTIGGGGLGDIAMRYGYYRYQADIMIIDIRLPGHNTDNPGTHLLRILPFHLHPDPFRRYSIHNPRRIHNCYTAHNFLVDAVCSSFYS